MNKSSLNDFSGWHIALVLLLTFMLASPFTSMAWPHASELRSAGHAGMALYFSIFGAAIWFIALFILLPRRRNTSGIIVISALGHISLFVRYLLAFGLAVGLFWGGILFERIAS